MADSILFLFLGLIFNQFKAFCNCLLVALIFLALGRGAHLFREALSLRHSSSK